MSVKRYTKSRLEEVFNEILDNKIALVPIGNHALKRHQVYAFNLEGRNLILKYYYIDSCFEREISAIRMLSKFDFIPRIVKYGKFDDDREYLIMEKIDGMPLMNYEKHADFSGMYFQVGQMLKKIHSVKDPNYPTRTISQSYSALYERPFKIIGNLECDDNDKSLLMKGIRYFMSLLSNDYEFEPSLVHRDYDSRNILVARKHGELSITGVIDFEHAIFFDRYYDLAYIKFKLVGKNPSMLKNFEEGYGQNIEMSDRIILHTLFICLSIASWSKNVDQDFYSKAINTITEIFSYKGINL